MKWIARLSGVVTLIVLAVLGLQVQNLSRVNTEQARKLGETRSLVDQLAACQSNAACMTALLKPFRQAVSVAPEPIQIVPIPGPPGRDGRDGRDGIAGSPGSPGQNGQDGQPGQDGKDAPTPSPEPTATVTETATPSPEPSPTPTCQLPPPFC